MTATGLLDPLRAAPGGRYEDGHVVVKQCTEPGLSVRLRVDGRVDVRHNLDRLDDDLAELLATSLAPLTDDADVFERAFLGVIVTSHPDPLVAWERFYRASLDRATGYAEIHRHALGLLPRTTVLDLGASLGFLSLHLAHGGADVIAVERDAGTARLLATMSRRLSLPVHVELDTSALPDRCVEAVALLHVLEHVDESIGWALLVESMRLARRRVVIAVPFEEIPTPLYGHVRQLDAATLALLGERTDWQTRVHEHHGGWLVLDRPSGREST